MQIKYEQLNFTLIIIFGMYSYSGYMNKGDNHLYHRNQYKWCSFICIGVHTAQADCRIESLSIIKGTSSPCCKKGDIMPKKYSRQETLSRLETIKEEGKGISSLYQKNFVNWSGTSMDKNNPEYYSEIISEWLLKNIDILVGNNIRQVSRENYKVFHPELDENAPKTNREEERIAKELHKEKFYKELGEIFDYQVPLKKTQKDTGVGKIDLVAFNKGENNVYLLELKRRDNTETLLRCVLEIYTYWKQLNEVNFKKSFDFLPEDAKVIPAILIFKDSEQYKQYKSDHPNTRKLMKELGIQTFVVTPSQYTIVKEN